MEVVLCVWGLGKVLLQELETRSIGQRGLCRADTFFLRWSRSPAYFCSLMDVDPRVTPRALCFVDSLLIQI